VLFNNEKTPNFNNVYLYSPYNRSPLHVRHIISKLYFNKILILMLVYRIWSLLLKFIHMLLILERVAIHSLNCLASCFKLVGKTIWLPISAVPCIASMWSERVSHKIVSHSAFSHEMLCMRPRKTPKHKGKMNWCHCCTLEITFAIWITIRSLFYLTHGDLSCICRCT